jgi:hypothetical protein
MFFVAVKGRGVLHPGALSCYLSTAGSTAEGQAMQKKV